MAIEIKANDNAICEVRLQNASEKVEDIILKEPITLKKKDRFVIDTGLMVDCSEDYDELWVNAGINSDETNDTEDEIPHFMISERYTKGEEAKPIKLVGFYNGTKDVKLPAGTSVARLFYCNRLVNDSVYDVSQNVKTNAIFSTDSLLVCALKDEEIDDYEVETVVNPDTQETYIKITKKVGENE